MRFVVKPDRPEQVRRRRIRLYLLALALFAGGWTGGWLLHARQLQALSQHLQSAAARINELEASGRKLQADNVDLEQRLKVSEAALSTLRTEMARLNLQLERAHEELRFFNNLMDESVQQQGLAVHELRFQPTASPRVYRYSLVLRQNLKKARELEGRYWFTFEGTANDRSLRHRFPPDGESLPFRLKYFRQLQGQVDLPAGFMPETVTVHLQEKPRGRKAGQKDDGVIETTRRWQPDST